MRTNKTFLLTIFIVSMAFICFSYGSAYAAATDNEFSSFTEDVAPMPTHGANLITDAEGFGIDTGTGNLTVTAINGGGSSPVTGTYGFLVWASDGSYTYTLVNSDSDVQGLGDGEPGQDIFTYTLNDDAVGDTTARLIINIIGVNDAPSVIETGGDQTVNEGSTAINTGTFNDPDNSDTVTITASIGSINQDAGSSGNWSWSYTPSDGPSGPTVVTITATDSDGATGTDTFTLTVNNVAPVVTETGGNQTVNEGSEATNNGTFSDIGDDTVTITASIGSNKPGCRLIW